MESCSFASIFLIFKCWYNVDEQLNENNNCFLGKVKEIGDNGFLQCINLTNITIGFLDGSLILNDYALSNNPNLITIGFLNKNIIFAGEVLFADNLNLSTFPINKLPSEIPPRFLENCCKLQLSSDFLNTTTTSFGEKAFLNHINQILTIPASIINIGSEAFYITKVDLKMVLFEYPDDKTSFPKLDISLFVFTENITSTHLKRDKSISLNPKNNLDQDLIFFVLMKMSKPI